MKIGITFGCFIPLHVGHMAMIERSVRENDRTIIAVCGYDDDRGKDFIPFKDRYELIKKIYGDDPDIKIVLVDDKKIGLDGTFTVQNWEAWCDELLSSGGLYPDLRQRSDIEITWYSGDKSYIDKISMIYPNHNYVLLDRTRIPVSGTEIRVNPKEHKELINTTYIDYLYKHERL